MLFSTTDTIVGYEIIEQGGIVWGTSENRNLCDAISGAINRLEASAERNGFNAVIGVNYSAVGMTESVEGCRDIEMYTDYIVSAMGTMVYVISTNK